MGNLYYKYFTLDISLCCDAEANIQRAMLAGLGRGQGWGFDKRQPLTLQDGDLASGYSIHPGLIIPALFSMWGEKI